MKFLLSWAVLVVTVGVLHSSAEDRPVGISEDTLKQLSLNGGKLLDEEVKRALYGVKQMREVMVKNEEKHQHLMKSLRRSNDKKKGAAQLTQEVTGKLEEAEEQCKISLQSEWEECRPCLEDACKSFYTSTCRRGFSTFHTKVESFFHRVSSSFHQGRPQGGAVEVLVNQGTASPDVEVVRIEDSFNRLMDRVGALVSRTVTLVSRIPERLDAALLKTFSLKTSDQATDQEEQEQPTSDPFSPARDSAFLQGVGLEEVLDSFLDFGRSVVEEFGAVITQVFDDMNEAEEPEKKRERALFPGFLRNRRLCRDLRRQTSECWQLQDRCDACQGALLTECPSVRELHVELDEVSQLLEVSKEQYEEILAITQRHTEDTISWLSNMAAEFSWVTELADTNLSPQTSFHISRVEQDGEGDSQAGDTKVELNILNSSPVVLSVPAELEVQDPAFIQHVAQEALDKYKQMVRNHE